MAVTARNYSSVAVTTTLAAAVNASVTSMSVNASTGWPAAPFIAVLDPNTVNEEIILVGSAVGTSWSSVTRGFDSSPMVAHSSGASVQHMVVGIDFREAQNHAASTTANVHNLTVGSSVVGTTDTQTLTNKTLTLPIMSTITGPSGTITLPSATDTLVGKATTDTLTNKTLVTPTVTTPTSTNGTWTGGTVNPTTLQVSSVTVPTISSIDTLTNKSIDLGSNTVTGTKAQFNAALSGDDFVTLTGTETLTNKTLTTPSISGSGGALTLPVGPDTLMGVGTNFGAWTAGTVAAAGTGWTGYTWNYRYLTVGKTVFFSARLPLTGAGGSGGLTLPAPFTAFTWPSGTHRYTGTGAVLSNGAANLFTLHPYINSSSSTIAILQPGLQVNAGSSPNAVTTGVNKVVLDNWQTFTAAQFTAETGVTLASGDQIYVNLVIETA
jgi:hypothetical protein